jgi:hypothetical protein
MKLIGSCFAGQEREAADAHLLDPEHLIVNGLGGAFLHPTHCFAHGRTPCLHPTAKCHAPLAEQQCNSLDTLACIKATVAHVQLALAFRGSGLR